jgi:hypothetical protein
MFKYMLYVCIVIYSLHAESLFAQKVTIRNNEPRRDLNGNILDVHAGRLIEFGDRYYLYGDHYGNTNGVDDGQNYFVSYSSPDLVSWKYEGELIPKENLPGWKEKTLRYRSHVIYNSNTKKYVMFYNWRPVPGSFEQGNLVVSVSDSPTGPFEIVNLDFQTKHHPTEIGDFNLFVDDDNEAYLIYKIANPALKLKGQNFIERLSTDYLSSSGECSKTVGTGEAATMFKRNGKYYILFGKDCGFCPEGSNIYVKISNEPLGLYRNNEPLDIRADKLINAQSSFVATLNTTEGKQYIYIGDRWRSAPGIAYYKGHDYQYWSEPLQFDRKGNVKPIKWNNEWTVNLK